MFLETTGWWSCQHRRNVVVWSDHLGSPRWFLMEAGEMDSSYCCRVGETELMNSCCLSHLENVFPSSRTSPFRECRSFQGSLACPASCRTWRQADCLDPLRPWRQVVSSWDSLGRG